MKLFLYCELIFIFNCVMSAGSDDRVGLGIPPQTSFSSRFELSVKWKHVENRALDG